MFESMIVEALHVPFMYIALLASSLLIPMSVPFLYMSMQEEQNS